MTRARTKAGPKGPLPRGPHRLGAPTKCKKIKFATVHSNTGQTVINIKIYVIGVINTPCYSYIDTLRALREANSSITSLKSSSRRMSCSMLITARLESRSCDIDVRSLFFISFSFEKERSALQLVIIKTR